MKKAIVSGALALSCLFTATTGTLASGNASDKIVVWDGAEVVKNQTGKMTFTKDVKVYKKNAEGKFVSLVVPKGNFFRVYNVEKYNGDTYYNMSSGYRVKDTDLVVFRAMPIKIRGSFFKEPVSVNISRNSIKMNHYNPDSYIDRNYEWKIPYGEVISTDPSYLTMYEAITPDPEASDTHIFLDPTDLKIVEKSELKL